MRPFGERDLGHRVRAPGLSRRNSYAAIEQTVGGWAALIVLTIVIAAVLNWRVCNHRTESRHVRAKN